MALGAFFFSLMSLFVKLVGQRLSVQEIVLVRGLITLGISWALLRHAGLPAFGTRRRALLTRGFLGFAALNCFYYAVVHLPLAEATVLQYLNPLWASLLGAWYLGERIRRHELLYVVGAMLGVLAIAKPGFLFGGGDYRLNLLAVVAGLAGSLLSGAAYVGVRDLSKTEHPLVIVFYFPLVTVPASLPALLNSVWPTPREWILLVAIGITAQLGQVFITRGLKLERAGRATAMGYLQVVFAGLWGLLFFSDLPDEWALAGSLLILGCILGLTLNRTPEPIEK
jgi:drug/metabolite transporter (DMT)-like permease